MSTSGRLRTRPRGLLTAAVLAVGAVLAAGCAPAVTAAPSATPPSATPTSAANGRPNVVFVLTDDLSTNLLPYLPHVLDLQKRGTTFADYTVTDSLCCPSRSSIFSGKFPHDTGVFTNTGQDGGFKVFQSRGEESATFATDLQQVGYRTAMMGKYLNGYQPDGTVDGAADYVPPGWNEWDVAGNGYPEYGYRLNSDHDVRRYGNAPADYLTDVLSAKADDFITASAAARTPFLLEVASFAPHAPYTPAPQDLNAFPGLAAPRGPAFDTLPTDAPPWLASRAPLTPQETNKIDTAFRERAQAVQAVDRLIGSVESTLDKAGIASDTMIVFSSDNGYHLGEHRLDPGKMTAFDTDVDVPLVVAGPGVRAGATVTDPAQNVDLRPTFDAVGGAPTASDVDGRSLAPLLASGSGSDWRTASLVEHHGPVTDADDPDLPPKNSGNPPSYEAMRTDTATYVEYVDGSREYYDRATDPDELHNAYAQLPDARRTALHAALLAMTNCHGQTACWAAGHPAP